VGLLGNDDHRGNRNWFVRHRALSFRRLNQVECPIQDRQSFGAVRPHPPHPATAVGQPPSVKHGGFFVVLATAPDWTPYAGSSRFGSPLRRQPFAFQPEASVFLP
jgi:hypothetical protein